ncbi:unnamed protein product [Penicillium glandicola]
MIPGPGNGFISTEAQIPLSATSQDAPVASTGLPSSLDYLADISAHHGRTEPDLGTMMIDNQQHYFGWNAVISADQMSHRANLPFDSGSKDMLQMWLEPHTDSGSNGSIDLMRDSRFPLIGDNLNLTLDQQSRHSVDSDNIPNERFARVQQCWLAPRNTGRLINSLWRDIAMSPVDNIFSVQSSHLLSEPSVVQGSRCGFDEDCRRRLQAAFGPIIGPADMQSPINRSVPSDTPTSTLNHSEFPPAEILDMALDLFFRLFNPLLPFVHVPSFSAKKARPSLLYVMTLVGMTLLGTKGTTAFVSRNFSGALDKVTAEFAQCSVGRESTSGTMTLFATVLLLLNLAGLTGEKAHLEQCQPLYINVMSVAQRHGLFSATEGQILDMTLFETVPDIDMRWKAWSRIESTKRIIIGLLLLDSWYSTFLSTGPIAIPDSIQLILPCSESLFSAHSSTQWIHLIRGGKRILSSTILAPSENINVPTLESPEDDFCIQAVLAIVQLRQSESYHRLLSNRASYPFAPCHTYAMDGRARCLPSLQSQLITNYGETLGHLNALITWHNMCMTLTADIQIFDLAAGRAGPAPARKALDDIREWSQTPAARRACLHAAHIYKVMTNRKASDHPTFQSMFSLFSAGLVLGLYTFMASDSVGSPSGVGSVELMDDVDWRSVGTEGFTSFMEPGGSQTFTPTDDPAINFIRNGATIYLRGLPFHGGYQSARRILLDYASLLKDSGKWGVKQFSHPVSAAIVMAHSGTREYIPFEALRNTEGNDAEQDQPHRKRSNIWHRVDITSVLTVLLGSPLLLLAVALLALFWHESMRAIDGAEPGSYWVRIVNAGWAAQFVTVCTASIRTVVSFQAGLATAMVAGIVLETTGAPLLHGPFYSILRAVKAAPSNFWTATNFQPHLSRFIYALVLTEVLVTAATQFLSTIFLSDFGNGTFSQPNNSTNVSILHAEYNSNIAWSAPPAASWTFAELSESFDDRSGFHDTGHTFRAFLPFGEETQRAKLRHLRGPVPVMDHRIVCASPPLSNLSLDATMQTYVHLSGQIPTENLTYPLLIDQHPEPYINFTCKLPIPIFRDNNTVGESSLCVPNIRSSWSNWTVLNEDSLVQPYGYPETSVLFMVLDVVSTAGILGASGYTRAPQTSRSDGPWTILSNGSAHIETLRISACLTNLAMQTVTVGMNSTTNNLEPETTWDHHTAKYNTELSRLQLGVLSPDNTSSTNDRGILTLEPRSQWETFNIPAGTPGLGTLALVGDPVTFFTTILSSFPNFLISSLNYTLDPGVILSRKDPWSIIGTAHPIHVELFQDTLITTASPALALQALLTRICQMTYYEQLIKLQTPVTAETAFSLTVTIPVRWTGFVVGMALILVHSIIMVVVVVLFVRSTEISFIGSYWQTVAQVVSKETGPILEGADRMDDEAVRECAKQEKVVESSRDRWVLQESAGGRVTLGLIEN